jgi:hypothetical protein
MRIVLLTPTLEYLDAEQLLRVSRGKLDFLSSTSLQSGDLRERIAWMVHGSEDLPSDKAEEVGRLVLIPWSEICQRIAKDPSSLHMMPLGNLKS